MIINLEKKASINLEATDMDTLSLILIWAIERMYHGEHITEKLSRTTNDFKAADRMIKELKGELGL